MRETYPNLAYRIDDLFACGDRVVLRWTATGTQRGVLWQRIPASHKTFIWRGIHVLRLADGKIV